MIQDFFVQIFHKFCVIFRVFFFLCHIVQHGGGVDRLCQGPVHPVVYHGFSFPVCGVDNARSAVSVPCVFHCAVEQVFCSLDIFLRALSVFFVCGKRPLGDQSCPLNAVSRCCAVWFELVCRLLFVAVQISFPFFGKVFRDPPVVGRCPSKDSVDDPSGADSVLLFLCGVCRGEESFYCVHIGI